ncbi:MAG: hypothetical protein AAGB93_02760 [Planctomycetota bacterium]
MRPEEAMADERHDRRSGMRSRSGAVLAGFAGAVLLALGSSALGSSAPGRSAAGSQERPLLDPATGQTLRFQVPAPPSPEEVMLLQLRDGSVRWGSIETHDPDVIQFTLLSNGGRASVPWTLLDPRQAEELRTKFGYVEIEAEQALVDASQLVLEGGGVVEGVIVSREGDSFLVKTDGNLQMLPKRRVSDVREGLRLPALDVYSREELYGIYLTEADPSSAESQLALARKCESILDFVHAVVHFEKALELGLSVDVDKVTGMLARARVKAQNQEQLEYLREADRLRKRRRFDDALAMLEAFPATFPGSSLLEDSRKQSTRLLKARDAAGKELVRSRWNYWARKLTRAKALDDAFEASRTWAVEQASEEIQAKVLVDVQKKITAAATLEDVRQLWEARDRVRYTSTTYSTGTWLLGEGRAQAGGEEEETAKEAVSKVDEERQALENKIKRYLDNQRIARRSQAAEDEEDAAQTFWETWSRTDRASWLLAFYIEEAGDYDVRPRPRLRPCRTCGGTGAIELLVTGAVPQGGAGSVSLCPTCRGVKVVRSVYYR